MSSSSNRNGSSTRTLVALIGMLAVAGAAIAGVMLKPELLSSLRSSGNRKNTDLITEVATRGPFLISLTVQGHLDSRQNATLVSKVEGSTTIISIVPEGTLVQKGDVVCELDSSQLREQSKQQEISLTQAEAALAQAQENLEIQRTQNESDIAAAELQWKLALLDLEKYEKGEYPQQVKQLSGNVELAKEELIRAEENLAFTKDQVKKGYRTQNDLEAARIAVKQAELKLEGAKEELKVLTDYTYQRTIAELRANAAELERELARVKLKAKSAETQYVKDVEARRLTTDVEQERYARLIQQIEACTLRAPQAGEVVYANLSSSRRSSEPTAIEEGASVRERQAIINLPDVTQMKVDCRIHESLIGSIRPGLTARIRIDAYPEEVFLGKVATVSTVPMSGRWPNTDLREYETEIHLTDSLEKIKRLRPGLTSQVEILVDNRANVLQVPVQAVVAVTDQQFVYVLKEDGPERRQVKVGQSNQSHVEVVEGVDEGERVILNPRSRFEQEIADLEASLSADRDALEAKANEEVREQAAPAEEKQPPASRPAGPGGQGGPGGNPAAFMERFDSDKDGKLSQDELPERMKARFAEIDSDGDGSVSPQEFSKFAAANRPPGGAGAP